MKVCEFLQQVKQVKIPKRGYPVEETIAKDMAELNGLPTDFKKVKSSEIKSEKGAMVVAVASSQVREHLPIQELDRLSETEWVLINMDQNQCLWLSSSKPCFLYAAFTFLVENFAEHDISDLQPWVRSISFSVEKSTFDLFFTQYARLLRNLDRQKYIREYARLGFSHIEVNALAFPFPYETGVKGEFYPDFYTYCPALDQFVSSQLNQGIYPQEYLRANIERLKENTRLALKFGLVPGLLCFEPRSVPEDLFKKYPQLRGARVDHPFRSFKPRYNLSVVHPVVQKHYAEMLTHLMSEIPELGFLTIWSNDSGAGFEHTKSLYVGRNGGAYLIREWKDDEEIAKAAASNIIQFFRLLRDSGSRINPEFRVITRLESFDGEKAYLWPQIQDRIDVEANSLLAKGWESNYAHPQYPDVEVLGSAFHNTLLESEKVPLNELVSRNSRCYFYHSFVSHTNHEPLLGIPFPWLTYQKLKAASRLGIQTLAHVGGIHPPDKVPYAVNQEVFRLFQLDSALDIDAAVSATARNYTGGKYADDLVKGWKLVERAIRAFLPLSIYTHYGVVWQRLLVRPLVPDIDRIPEKERSYYERFMCTSVHNPNKVDLAKDVLFELLSKDYAQKAFSRIDQNVWKPLDSAIDLFRMKWNEATDSKDFEAKKVFEDQYHRMRALKYLYMTLRNTAVWVYAVHEYLDVKDPDKRTECRQLLSEMIEKEIQNCQELIELWETAGIEWMIVSGSEETAFIHGENFPHLLDKKIALMEKHRNDEPFIDPDYMFRLPNNPYP
jgi:hypothetical protein